MAVDPKCLDVGVEFGAVGSFEVTAEICNFSLHVPNIPLPPQFILPAIDFPPPLPIPKVSFALSCDPNKPIDLSAGIAFGGGRIPCTIPSDEDDDDQDEAA